MNQFLRVVDYLLLALCGLSVVLTALTVYGELMR